MSDMRGAPTHDDAPTRQTLVRSALYLFGLQLLFGLKKTGVQAACTVSSGTLTVLLSFLFCTLWADFGLILAMTIGLALQAGLTNWFAWKNLHAHRARA